MPGFYGTPRRRTYRTQASCHKGVSGISEVSDHTHVSAEILLPGGSFESVKDTNHRQRILSAASRSGKAGRRSQSFPRSNPTADMLRDRERISPESHHRNHDGFSIDGRISEEAF